MDEPLCAILDGCEGQPSPSRLRGTLTYFEHLTPCIDRR